MCVSGIGFQFHNHDTKKNILSEKKIGGKNHVLNKKSRISGKSDLDFKDTKYRL